MESAHTDKRARKTPEVEKNLQIFTKDSKSAYALRSRKIFVRCVLYFLLVYLLHKRVLKTWFRILHSSSQVLSTASPTELLFFGLLKIYYQLVNPVIKIRTLIVDCHQATLLDISHFISLAPSCPYEMHSGNTGRLSLPSHLESAFSGLENVASS